LLWTTICSPRSLENEDVDRFKAMFGEGRTFDERKLQ
jgi:hypothetical protein